MCAMVAWPGHSDGTQFSTGSPKRAVHSSSPIPLPTSFLTAGSRCSTPNSENVTECGWIIMKNCPIPPRGTCSDQGESAEKSAWHSSIQSRWRDGPWTRSPCPCALILCLSWKEVGGVAGGLTDQSRGFANHKGAGCGGDNENHQRAKKCIWQVVHRRVLLRLLKATMAAGWCCPVQLVCHLGELVEDNMTSREA